jgi:hypothetical protein
MKESYYKKNKALWRKGGKYYYYKPKNKSSDNFSIKKGLFILRFD